MTIANKIYSDYGKSESKVLMRPAKRDPRSSLPGNYTWKNVRSFIAGRYATFGIQCSRNAFSCLESTSVRTPNGIRIPVLIKAGESAFDANLPKICALTDLVAEGFYFELDITHTVRYLCLPNASETGQMVFLVHDRIELICNASHKSGLWRNSAEIELSEVRFL